MINLNNPTTLHVCQPLHEKWSLHTKQNIFYLNVLEVFLSEPTNQLLKQYIKINPAHIIPLDGATQFLWFNRHIPRSLLSCHYILHRLSSVSSSSSPCFTKPS